MEMVLDIHITKLTIEILPAVRNDNIKAFVNLIFHTDQGEIKIKNGTIRLKDFGKAQKLSYDVPAVRTRNAFRKCFFLNNLDLYKEICVAVLRAYEEQTGEKVNYDIELEDISIDEIPV